MTLQTVMVGDSEVDKISAQNATIPFIGVSYGYDLHPSSTPIMINHFDELPHVLNNLSII